MGQELQPIANHPTFTMCFGVTHRLLNSNFVVLELGKHFNITLTDKNSNRYVLFHAGAAEPSEK